MRKLASIAQALPIWSHGRIPQAMLLNYTPGCELDPIRDRILTQVLCQAIHAPCGSCHICEKILQDTHPDIVFIRPEQSSTVIKIEQIRDLQAIAYRRPQWGDRQIFVIEPADAMNHAASSALLKILEEPSVATVFLLISTSPQLLLPTIVSRCQQINVYQNATYDDPLALGSIYSATSAKAKIYAERHVFLEHLDALVSGASNICTISEQWAKQTLPDMLSFFYTVLVSLIRQNLLSEQYLDPEYQHLKFLKMFWRPEDLFAQIDEIHAILQADHSDVNLNVTLLWERLLLQFLRGTAQNAN